MKIPKWQHELARYYKRGKLVSYFLNNAAKTSLYRLKISENIGIGRFFQSRIFFHLSSNLHTSCLSTFKVNGKLEEILRSCAKYVGGKWQLEKVIRMLKMLGIMKMWWCRIFSLKQQTEESREVFNMKKFFCVVMDLFERYIEEGSIIGFCRQEWETEISFRPTVIQEAL